VFPVSLTGGSRHERVRVTRCYLSRELLLLLIAKALKK
jgi:hypothetical protein